MAELGAISTDALQHPASMQLLLARPKLSSDGGWKLLYYCILLQPHWDCLDSSS